MFGFSTSIHCLILDYLNHLLIITITYQHNNLMVEQTAGKVNKPRKVKKNKQRALRACDSCRRMKTRCIPSPLPEEVQCLRCDTFNLRCSFQDLLSDDEGAETLAALKEQSSGKGNSSGSTTYESAELTKRLLKSGYSPEDFAVHAKLASAKRQ